MTTNFGKELRKLRIERDERILDMSKKLGVSSSFLSAVENGKKRIPSNLVSKIKDTYQLGSEEVQRLMVAADESAAQVKINLEGQDAARRSVAMAFARKFDTMDEEMVKKLKELFE